MPLIKCFKSPVGNSSAAAKKASDRGEQLKKAQRKSLRFLGGGGRRRRSSAASTCRSSIASDALAMHHVLDAANALQDTEEEVAVPPFLKKAKALAQERRWNDLGELLRSTDEEEKGMDKFEVDAELLNCSVQNDAPLAIIRLICEIRPETIRETHDETGRTALHEACAACAFSSPASSNGDGSGYFDDFARRADALSRSSVVSYLLELDTCIGNKKGRSVVQPDCMGRLPLHLACGAGLQDVYCEDYTSILQVEDNDRGLCDSPTSLYDRALTPPDGDVIELIIRSYPRAINVEDNEERTPLEYAIMAEVRFETIKLLRKASERMWKHQQQKKARKILERMRLATEEGDEAQDLRNGGEDAADAESRYRRPSLLAMDSRRKVKKGAIAA